MTSPAWRPGRILQAALLGQLSPRALAAAISLIRLPAQASTRVLLDAGPGGIPVLELTDKQLLTLARSANIPVSATPN